MVIKKLNTGKFLCNWLFMLIALSMSINTAVAAPEATTGKEESEENASLEDRGAAQVPSGVDLVNMDFPEPTEIKDIIKAVSIWTGKNVILDRNVTGKVQIISPRKVTKEEAYQAFLSALSMLNLTTVQTGQVIKIMKVRNAVRDNLKTYIGSNWVPRTDEVITQIIPLKYIDSKQVQATLARIVSSNAMIAYEPTNTLIVTDSGYKVKRVLEILQLLDVQTQQPKVMIVPVKYSDPKSIADKVNQILQASGAGAKKPGGGGAFNAFKLLVDERTNSVIIFGPPRTIKDVKDLVHKFDAKTENADAQASIHVRPLDYADAKKLAATLSSLASGGDNKGIRRPPIKPQGAGNNQDGASVADLGSGVKITAEEATNSLLITGSRTAYDALNSLIRKLDIRRSQVFVEADILDLNSDNNFNFGTSIFTGAGKSDGSGSKQVIGWQAAGMAPLVVGSTATGTDKVSDANKKEIAGAFAQNMTIGIISGTKVSVPGLGSFTPGALINLIKTDGNAKLLSSPHILTANNEQASITVGEKLFFNTSVVNPQTQIPVQKVETENVDLTLSIKPNISNTNYVTIQLELESSSANGQAANGLPKISKRKMKQTLTVKNGQTIVVSGLVRNSESETYQKLPLLGDLPLIGWLFRNSILASNKSNLVVFLTPHVVHGAQDLAAIYKAKMKERDEYFSALYGDDFKEGDFYKTLPKEEDGAYKPSEIDEAEEKRLLKQREDVYKATGYKSSQEDITGAASSSEPASEITVPTGIGGDGMSDAPAPASINQPAQGEAAPEPRRNDEDSNE